MIGNVLAHRASLLEEVSAGAMHTQQSTACDALHAPRGAARTHGNENKREKENTRNSVVNRNKGENECVYCEPVGHRPEDTEGHRPENRDGNRPVKDGQVQVRGA